MRRGLGPARDLHDAFLPAGDAGEVNDRGLVGDARHAFIGTFLRSSWIRKAQEGAQKREGRRGAPQTATFILTSAGTISDPAAARCRTPIGTCCAHSCLAIPNRRASASAIPRIRTVPEGGACGNALAQFSGAGSNLSTVNPGGIRFPLPGVAFRVPCHESHGPDAAPTV